MTPLSLDIGTALSILSLILSIFFWWNARQQGKEASNTLTEASRVLGEIRTQIIGWQNELNKTAIEMLSSRPEMVAKQAMLMNSQAHATFSSSMASTITKLIEESKGSPATAGQSMVILDRLLKHQETIVLEEQRLALHASSGHLTRP